MKPEQQTQTNLRSSLALALALALAIWSPVQSQSAEPAEGNVAATMMERCQAMKAQKQKLKEGMKAQDAQLTEQLAKMNSAPEDKKVADRSATEAPL